MSIKVSKLQEDLLDKEARLNGCLIEIDVLKKMLRERQIKPLFTVWGREYGWREVITY